MTAWWRTEKGRASLRELGSIVLGVLIALAIGEVADAIRWRVRVHQAAAAMRQESAGNRFNVVERQLYAPCVRRRLAEIDAVLRDAWRTGTLPPIADVDRPGMRVIETAAWDVATSDGTIAHMDRGAARDTALIYAMATRSFADMVASERDIWMTLSMLEQPGGPVDPNVLATLTEARARAVLSNEDLRRLAAQADRMMLAHDIPVEYVDYRDRAGLIRYVRSRPICQPLRVGAPSPPAPSGPPRSASNSAAPLPRAP